MSATGGEGIHEKCRAGGQKPRGNASHSRRKFANRPVWELRPSPGVPLSRNWGQEVSRPTSLDGADELCLTKEGG